MIQVPGEVADGDELLRRVRQEVLRSSQAGTRGQVSDGQPWTVSSLSLEPTLAPARQMAAIGTTVPTMRRVPWLLRPLARLVGWLMLRPLQMITRPQRSCNQALIESIDLLGQRIGELEGMVSRLDGRLRGLQAPVLEAQLFCREMATLQSRFDFLDTWARETLADLAVGFPERQRWEEGNSLGILSPAQEETWEGV
jgi:hypothetical protein